MTITYHTNIVFYLLSVSANPPPMPDNEAPQSSPENIKKAQEGADLFYREEARRIVAKMDNIPLADLINNYCTDPEFAEQQVSAYLADLPSSEELVMRAFILFQILVSTRDTLKEITEMEFDVQKEIRKAEESGPAVDNEAIRKSAGFSDKIDREVAEESKTDKAKENDVTDEDIGESASQDVSYEDATANASPYITFVN